MFDKVLYVFHETLYKPLKGNLLTQLSLNLYTYYSLKQLVRLFLKHLYYSLETYFSLK